jgi:glutaryl-CoA dehydrogenase (non-decarboxylating)
MKCRVASAAPMPLLADDQEAKYSEFKEFVSLHVEPFATAWDRDQQIPRAMVSRMGDAGHLGALIPRAYSGQGWNTVTFGLLNEAFGRGSSALTDVITCQAMVSTTLLKWGTQEQRNRWIPSLAKGETLGAFALTEPSAGSDTQSLTTNCVPTSGDANLILNGHKKWISCAQFADLFLVFGMIGQCSVACLITRGTPGFCITPIRDMMGFRAAGLGELHFDNVLVPAANVVGKPGFGLSHVAAVGLHCGRVSTACSGAGLLRGCLEESIAYAATRAIATHTLGDLGMIQSLITRMGTDSEAGRLLCLSACQAEDDRHPEALRKTLMAKYFTSRAAVRAASDAVQIRGASGCHGSSPVSRFYRDAKILEISEGTTQIHEQMLGQMLVNRADQL